MQALILCGGLGTRLRSVVSDVPKAMASIQGTPFVELLIRSLARQGLKHFVLATGYRAAQIEAHFGDGARWDVRIEYSREHDPRGTAGALKLAEAKLSGPFLVLNGDTYAEFGLASLLQVLEQESASIAMVLKRVEDPGRYGSVRLDQSGRILGFVEKGSGGNAGLINAGAYLMQREVLDLIPAERACSLEKDILPGMLARGIFGLEMPGPFIDIGVPEDYVRAQSLLAGILEC